jgi:membrane protease YdiL (CAAX protease family)
MLAKEEKSKRMTLKSARSWLIVIDYRFRAFSFPCPRLTARQISSVRHRVLLIVGLLLALGGPELPVTRFFASRSTMTGRLEVEAFFWLITILVILYVLFIERRPLSSIGLRRPTWKTFVFAIIGAVVLVAGIVVLFAVVFPALHLNPPTEAMSSIKRTPFWFRLLLVTRAAVFEEICYRGYPIERAGELFGQRWIGAAIAWAAFTLAHLAYWGLAALIIPAFGGLVLTLFYVWRRDLVSNMIAHFLADGSGFLLG